VGCSGHVCSKLGPATADWQIDYWEHVLILILDVQHMSQYMLQHTLQHTLQLTRTEIAGGGVQGC